MVQGSEGHTDRRDDYLEDARSGEVGDCAQFPSAGEGAPRGLKLRGAFAVSPCACRASCRTWPRSRFRSPSPQPRAQRPESRRLWRFSARRLSLPPSASRQALPPSPPSASRQALPPSPPSASRQALPPSPPSASRQAPPAWPPSASRQALPPWPPSASRQALPPWPPSASRQAPPPWPPSASRQALPPWPP